MYEMGHLSSLLVAAGKIKKIGVRHSAASRENEPVLCAKSLHCMSFYSSECCSLQEKMCDAYENHTVMIIQ